MSEIKKITNKDLNSFLEISRNAYPRYNANTQEEKERFLKRYKEIQDETYNQTIYGLYRKEQLLGGMILYDYKMNMFNNDIKATGIGSVAVDFLHKKEKVAKEMLLYFLNYSLSNQANIALLYPFRPDFYKKMGFGYGPKMNQYTIKPECFPKKVKPNIEFLTKDDVKEIYNCYQDVYQNTHGMIETSEEDLLKLFNNPRMRIVGYKNNGKIEGYVTFTFKGNNDNFLINDMYIHRFVYRTKEALLNISAFLNSQSDQIQHIILNTFDDSLYHLLFDPRDHSQTLIPSVYHRSNIQGVGLMYRIINTEGLFKDLKKHNFNNISIKLKITVIDEFFEENNKPVIIHFTEGHAKIAKANYEVEIKIKVEDLSSLIMGTITFKTLYNYSLIDISDINYLDVVNKLFSVEDEPICLTDF